MHFIFNGFTVYICSILCLYLFNLSNVLSALSFNSKENLGKFNIGLFFRYGKNLLLINTPSDNLSSNNCNISYEISSDLLELNIGNFKTSSSIILKIISPNLIVIYIFIFPIISFSRSSVFTSSSHTNSR